MQTDGNLSALFAFVSCLIWYASMVILLALGQPLLALVVLLAGILRPRRLPHLVALLFTWPHLRIGFNLNPAPGQHYLGIDLGVIGLEWHPVCWAMHRLLDKHDQTHQVQVIPLDLGDLDLSDLEADADGRIELDADIAAALRRQFEEWQRAQVDKVGDDEDR